MQVVVIGAREVEAKLAALPTELRRATQAATTPAVNLEAAVIRSLTPRRTGTLAGSIQTEVTSTADGARGRVYSELRYTPFVERGTAKHGAAQHMFERGSQQVESGAVDVYRVAMDEVVASFG